MKAIYLIGLFAFIATQSRGQSDTSKKLSEAEAKEFHLNLVKKTVQTDLTKQISNIPINGEIDAVKKFTSDFKNKTIQTDYNIGYKFKLKLKDGQDLIRVNAFSESTSVKYDLIIAYTCTDPRHIIKHTASTLSDMKKLQKQYGCSGITMLIVDGPTN